jgi:hypothetical protein
VSGFDPTKYLTKVKGNDYLEVKHRLLWLRSAEPNAVIDTELMAYTPTSAIFRAKVLLPNGASATGWGSEATDDFADFLEKAETKALGRALAALGYGTQFCQDHDFGADQQRVVDSPVARPQQLASSPRLTNTAPVGARMSAANRLLSREAAPWAQHLLSDGQIVTDTGEILGTVASEKQQKFAKSLVFKQWDGDFQTFDAMTEYVFGSDLYALTTEQVSAIIDYMQKSTTKWTDPRQLDLRLQDRQPPTTPSAPAPPPTTTPKPSLYQRIKAEDPAEQDARNTAANDALFARMREEEAAADADEARLEEVLGMDDDFEPIEVATVPATPYNGQLAESDFAEFSGLLSKITTPGKRASETLQALQVWMSEKATAITPASNWPGRPRLTG